MNALKTNLLALLLVFFAAFQLQAGQGETVNGLEGECNDAQVENCEQITTSATSNNCYALFACELAGSGSGSGSSSSSSSGSSDDDQGSDIQVGDIVQGRVSKRQQQFQARVSSGERFILENTSKFQLKAGDEVLFRVTATPKGGSAGMGEVTVIIL